MEDLGKLYVEGHSTRSQDCLPNRGHMIYCLERDDQEAEAIVSRRIAESKLQFEAEGYGEDVTEYGRTYTYEQLETHYLHKIFISRFASLSRDSIFERTFMISCLHSERSEAVLRSHTLRQLQHMFHSKFVSTSRKYLFEHSFMAKCLRSDDSVKRYANE